MCHVRARCLRRPDSEFYWLHLALNKTDWSTRSLSTLEHCSASDASLGVCTTADARRASDDYLRSITIDEVRI